MMLFAMVMVKHRMKWLFLQPRICSFCHYHDHHGFKSTIFFLIKAAVEVIIPKISMIMILLPRVAVVEAFTLMVSRSAWS